MAIENAIIIRGKTRLELLTDQYNTKQQAEFYIQQTAMVQTEKKIKAMRASAPAAKIDERVMMAAAKESATQNFGNFEEEHHNFYAALDAVQRAMEGQLKTKIVDRAFLPSYIFSDKDLVLVLGQDGLVANAAKYLNNIPIIGINPDAARYDGILLPFTPADFSTAVHNVVADRYASMLVTMAEARLTDGQRLLAFNDLFIGPNWHTSARYQIRLGGVQENQSSSGIIVSTGAGSTGWMSSLFNQLNGMQRTFGGAVPPATKVLSKAPTKTKPEANADGGLHLQLPWDADQIAFAVREPFQSKASGISITSGLLGRGEQLEIESFMPGHGIIFSDGIEKDYLQFNAGAIATIGIADQKAKLVLKK
jgi:NAD kinase